MGFAVSDGWLIPLVYGFSGLIAGTGVVLVFAARGARQRLEEKLAMVARTGSLERERADLVSRELAAERTRLTPLTEGNDHLFAALGRGYVELAACKDRASVAQTLGTVIARAFAPRQHLVFFANGRTGKDFELAVSGGDIESGWSPGACINDTMGRLGLVARRRVAMDDRDFDVEPPIVREQIAASEPSGFAVDVAVPIVVGQTVVGLISVGGSPLPLSSARGGLELLAAHVSAVLRGLDAMARVERLRNTDELTGLGSKSWFVAEGSELLYKCRTENAPAALVVLGIDDFRVYVERNGHQVADRVLKSLAELLRSIFVPDGLLARWTGVEFIALVPGASSSAASALADRVRALVSARDWPSVNPTDHVRLTISAGVAFLPANGTTLDDLIESAADALTAARWTGDATHVAASGDAPQTALSGSPGSAPADPR